MFSHHHNRVKARQRSLSHHGPHHGHQAWRPGLKYSAYARCLPTDGLFHKCLDYAIVALLVGIALCILIIENS